jgi:hypothetical protein
MFTSKGTDLRSVSELCLFQLLRVSVLHKSEIITYTNKINDAYISIEIITYKLLRRL